MGKSKQNLIDEIASKLVRRHSTAAVLLHHAVAERLGLGPTDHKCLDLLREHGPLSGSEIAALTGLTSGAITGVVARLEGAGYLHREPDPSDGRKQVLSTEPERLNEIRVVLGPLRRGLIPLLAGFDVRQLKAVSEFLTGATELAHTHARLLRAEARSGQR